MADAKPRHSRIAPKPGARLAESVRRNVMRGNRLVSFMLLFFSQRLVDLTNTGNNCERGGFVCEGYTQRTAFPRTATPKQYPTPIQSKDSFPDHGGLQARYETLPLYHLRAVISLHATLLLSARSLRSHYAKDQD